MGNTTLREIQDELRALLDGRAGIGDAIIAPVVFVVVNAFAGMPIAAYAGIVGAVIVVAYRVARRSDLQYAFSGLFGTGIAIAFALRSGQAQDYFLPGIVTGAGTTLLALLSILVRRPLVAFMSRLTRRWPMEWYWHSRIRPAYTRATWLWVAFFGLRTALQGWLFVTDQTTALGFVRAATGWPGLLLLLATTFIVGRNRLLTLGGPSVTEFESGAPESEWTGQQHGF
jgi:hypothetical protein